MPANVAIIGGGPAGLVAARYLRSEGLDIRVFEQGTRVGGQWSGEPGHSGVWPAMRTNTSRLMTSFSDLSHGESLYPVYPTNQQVGEYLASYAEHTGTAASVRLNSPVQRIERTGKDEWAVTAGGRTESFRHAVVAVGRYHKPRIPGVPGLNSFTGKGGVLHSFAYKHPDRLRGLRVVVAGGAISSLEISSDLAMAGADVTVSQRRQRYIVPKLANGIPIDHVAFTRFAALAEEAFPVAAVGASLKQFVLSHWGNPAQLGAHLPAEDILQGGVAMSQYFLPLLAEGRIAVKPWLASVQGNRVTFADGTEQIADAILFGTGFELDMPFLSEEIRATLDLDAQHVDLYKRTFHPDLPGLAFTGMYEQVGPYFPSLELQARWIAYSFSGRLRASMEPEEMRAGIEQYRARRGGPQLTTLHANAAVFAREAGVEPDIYQWPEYARALLFGPLLPISYRMSGRDALPDAPQRFATQIRAFGCIPADELTEEQRGKLQVLAAARNEPRFAAYVEQVCAAERPGPRPGHVAGSPRSGLNALEVTPRSLN